MTTERHGHLMDQQIAYYRARASEYDEWFFRKGRYDRGPEKNRQWFWDAAEVRRAIQDAGPSGAVLDVACGTGLWTEVLLEHAAEVTAVDTSPEMLALGRERIGSERVRLVEADIFAWTPDRRYDFVFFGFGYPMSRRNGSSPSGDSCGRASVPAGRSSSWTPATTRHRRRRITNWGVGGTRP